MFVRCCLVLHCVEAVVEPLSLASRIVAVFWSVDCRFGLCTPDVCATNNTKGILAWPGHSDCVDIVCVSELCLLKFETGANSSQLRAGDRPSCSACCGLAVGTCAFVTSSSQLRARDRIACFRRLVRGRGTVNCATGYTASIATAACSFETVVQTCVQSPGGDSPCWFAGVSPPFARHKYTLTTRVRLSHRPC